MKKLVIFYSYTGNAKRLAQEFSAKESDALMEIRDIRRPCKVKAYSLGCFAAIGGKAWKVQPFDKKLDDYDELVLFSPVWASNPPPAVNALLEQLPAGKSISVKMVSASGKSDCKERLEGIFKAKACTLTGLEDIKA